MGQNITLKIAGKDYSLKASTPEMERYMRLASEEINKLMAKYDEKFPDRNTEDKMAFVALNETVSKIMNQDKVSSIQEEALSLKSEIDNYLKDKTGN